MGGRSVGVGGTFVDLLTLMARLRVFMLLPYNVNMPRQLDEYDKNCLKENPKNIERNGFSICQFSDLAISK